EAQLLVLKGAQMPAVLVSIAHLKNPQEESLLESDDFLAKVSRVLFEALLSFIGGQDASN
ncbi:MAG: N-acetylmuramoyl-L-alanine amidase, partial [Nitrospinota bacterium]|nr:N-acetylmuramoyl-L-alanine amidase [Nitrospinota bacterium]